MRLEVTAVRARLREPFASATGSVSERRLLLVVITGRDGIVGYGESAPLQPYHGVTIEDCRAAIEDCRQVLAGADGAPLPDVLAACRHAAVLPQALAAIDLALWDLAGRRAGVPVWRLLTCAGGDPADAERAADDPPAPIEVNATIAHADRAGAAAAASRSREAGFKCVKVKVGCGDDFGRVAAVRAAAGPEMAIRLDANGAWSVDEALSSLRAFEPAGIELCEEPVTGVDELAHVAARTPVPIALDESASLPGALDRLVADSVCLKVAACGGISGLLEAAGRARAAGYGVYLSSSLDGPLGIAAALHAAAVIRPDRACGLATLGWFCERTDPLPPVRGRIAIPNEIGLGNAACAWYELAVRGSGGS